MSPSVLLIDDDLDVLASMGRYLEHQGYEVFREETGGDGVATFEGHRPDLVLLDLRLPDAVELSVLRELRDRDAVVVLLTGHGDIETAVAAMRMGAENFLTKPVELEHLTAVLSRALERARLLRENERLRHQSTREAGEGAMGSSPAMRQLALQVELLAESDRTTVLLTGESGTGKGWVARRLHLLGPRARAPFVEVNAAGLTPTFLASELFGHEKGAFTDARERRDGLFTEADGGSLFLDEIGELALELQPRLLNVLETRAFRRLGGSRELRSDVRFIAATNRDLEAAVAGGSFREDLYYRLKVAPLHLPPVRERSEDDRLALLHHLLKQLRAEIPGSPAGLDDDTVGILLGYPWPGNIREMRNVLERAVIFAGRADVIRPAHLPPEIRTGNRGPGAERRRGFQPESMEEVERRHIRLMLKHHGGNRSRSARDLGIARTTLIQKIARYGLGEVGRTGT
ncbi:MAG: sigma-54-dependent Fis family transcriptional regulator [Gemmatimonadales bacterium]|nr:MAG: sigma-54-dependent Fis family transcriptional regulator [Gemmatimonadales bacterium]